MSGLLPSECPNCGRLHQGFDFNEKPGPVQAEIQRLRDALERITQLTLFEEGNGLVVARQVARAALDGTPSAAE